MMRAALRPLAALPLLAVLGILAHDPRPEQEPPKQPNDRFLIERAWPDHDIPPGAYANALAEARAMPESFGRSATGAWQEAGPTNVGGRITAIAGDPNVADTYWVGSADGGVLRTTDDGDHWTPLLDDFGGLSIGALAHHPTQSGVLLAGTGEANASGDSYDGIGMLKSTDGGDTWALVGLESSQRIGKIAWDVTDPDRIHVAVSGGLFSAGPDRGMYRSTDGGATWHQTLFVSDSTSAIDVVIDPTNGDNVWCAMWERLRGPDSRDVAGLTSRMWRSTDGGDTWSQMTNGVPVGSDVARIGLAVAPSSPSTLYAVYSKFSSGSGTYLDAVYESTNGGTSWNQTAGSGLGNPYSSFGWYFGQIRVSPANADLALVLGVSLERTTNGGSNWSEITGSQHVDFHDVWIDPSNPTRWIAGNDGGVYRSYNGGSSWSKCPDLPITQFYAITVDPQLPQRIYGGTQDNSTPRTLTGALDDWDVLIGGDGFTVQVDPTSSDVIYGEAQYGWLVKSTDGWNFSTSMYFGGTERTNWHMPFVMDPSDRMRLVAGTYRVWETTNGGSSWNPISPDLTDGPGSGGLTFGTLTTLDIAPSDPATIYAGSDDGNVHVTTNGGTTWTEVDAGLPVRYVKRVTADPFDDAIAYCAVSGYNQDDYTPHVFRTTNHGAVWADITGNLPNAPVNDVIVDPQDPATLYAGTDVGVYLTSNLGATWAKFGRELPLSVVVDLELHDASRTLVAGTHGRSAFTLDLSVGEVTDVAVAGETKGVELSAPRPNPSRDRTELAFALPATARVELSVHDVAGRRVRTVFGGVLPAGRHAYDWDGRNATGRPVAAGVYFAELRTGGEVRTVKVIRTR